MSDLDEMREEAEDWDFLLQADKMTPSVQVEPKITHIIHRLNIRNTRKQSKKGNKFLNHPCLPLK